MASITISTDGVEEKFALESPTVTLGRGLESDIRLKDIKASRRHCQIVRSGKGFQVIDLNSGNGTYINGVQIKQQALNPGDKIQIGSTTITFADGDGARSAAPSPGKAAPTAAAPTKPVSSQIPVAATKKITAQVAVAKPATQGVPKTGSQPVAKTGTQGVPKTGTAAMKKTTHRPPTGRTGKVSATARFHAEGRRKKVNPVAVLLGVIGAGFIITLGVIFLGGGGREEELIQAQFDEAIKKANELYDKDQLDAAVKEYQKAHDLIVVNEKFKSRAAEIRGRINEIKGHKMDLATAEKRFQDLKAKVDACKMGEAEALYVEVKKFKDDTASANVPWKKDVDDMIAALNRLIDTKKAEDKRLDFQAVRNEVVEKYLTKEPRHYSNAVKAFREFREQQGLTDDAKNKADNEIKRVNGLAKEELLRLTTRSANMAEAKDEAGALALLKQQRPRFEHSDLREDLEKLIGKYDK
jgi:pSer/pThr/pTyr-binding forkhead associated (FHA) protein